MIKIPPPNLRICFTYAAQTDTVMLYMRMLKRRKEVYMRFELPGFVKTEDPLHGALATVNPKDFAASLWKFADEIDKL